MPVMNTNFTSFQVLLGLTLSAEADSLSRRSVDLECNDPDNGKLQHWIYPGVEYLIKSPNYPELYPSKYDKES